MFQFALFAAFAISLTLGVPANNSRPRGESRIVGGQSVEIEDYPYQLSLMNNGIHICGASVLSSKYGITAAHCVSGSDATQFSVRGGSSFRTAGGQIVPVSVSHIHPKYEETTNDYDIAIIEFGSPLILGNAIKPIDLPTQNQFIQTNAIATVSGWGAVADGSADLPNQLQAVQVPIVSQVSCENSYGIGTITSKMVCAGYTSGAKDACSGDNGGPLVVNGELIGIMSWGYGCARPHYPGVYARVPALRDYINTITGL